MSTVREVITRALRKANVVGRGQSADADILVDALATLNEMLEHWRDGAVKLDLGTVTLDTDLTIDGAAIRTMVYNLAVAVANDEGVEVRPGIKAVADSSFAALAGRFLGTRRVKFDPALCRTSSYDIESG